MRYGPLGRQAILTGIGVPPGSDLRLAGSALGALAPTLSRRRRRPPHATSVHGGADHVEREDAIRPVLVRDLDNPAGEIVERVWRTGTNQELPEGRVLAAHAPAQCLLPGRTGDIVLDGLSGPREAALRDHLVARHPVGPVGPVSPGIALGPGSPLGTLEPPVERGLVDVARAVGRDDADGAVALDAGMDEIGIAAVRDGGRCESDDEQEQRGSDGERCLHMSHASTSYSWKRGAAVEALGALGSATIS